jgi:hypothetical protein
MHNQPNKPPSCYSKETMKIYIPPKDSFLAPAGCFPAVCSEVKQFPAKNKSGALEDVIRLVFVLKTASPKGTRYVAGKNYPVNDLSEFYADLEAWLGERVRGTEFDLDSLPGEEATVCIAHIRNEQHAEAYRLVTHILPPTEPVQQAA